ncbi:unnamed protein product [Urochloa humidicola]
MTPASDDPQAPSPGSGLSRIPQPQPAPSGMADGRDGGGAETRVPAREGSLASVFPAMALLLLSAVVSGWDADVTRKRRDPRARAQAPSWWAFRRPIVPSPPAKSCDDCGTTQTGQWRSGPMGPGTLCNTCGARRWAHGQRWGVPRRRRRTATATTVSDQPSPPSSQENRPDGQIYEQGSASPAPSRVTSPPPATQSLPAPATLMAAGSEQLPPPPSEIPASQSTPPDSTHGNQIVRNKPGKRKFPSPTTAGSELQLTPLPEIPASPQSPPSNRSDVGKQKVRRKPVKQSSPSPATAGTDSIEQSAPPEMIPLSENSLPLKKRKNKAAAERQCVHCGTSETPQWRWSARKGPEGRRILCNACGVRNMQGRLLPEYRPLASPTFDRESHATLHRKVLKLRRQRRDHNQHHQPPAPVAPVDDSQDVDPMALPSSGSVDHLRSKFRGGDSANNAGASSVITIVAGPVGEVGWL